MPVEEITRRVSLKVKVKAAKVKPNRRAVTKGAEIKSRAVAAEAKATNKAPAAVAVTKAAPGKIRSNPAWGKAAPAGVRAAAPAAAAERNKQERPGYPVFSFCQKEMNL